ncbi:3-oxoacyl-ACP synthase [Galbibacter sp. EGI 63066]|uniref:3-oxoacyl-ACP synthase n=1 Tax=Galbibacter sp. EGI 63066 TaxID=2993559 RepID=UPI00224928FD|nr:3-oxoacyl-ACP synthase [Galbibacter sp. EGI 63066]MCX2678339.1 3-oxoacyl-ACP synthase [Galbibacter sp. EGI 63066]
MDKKEFYIKSYCTIENGVIALNGRPVFQDDEKDFLKFIKSAYKSLEIGYPKFYKMDALSKLSFIAADVLLDHEKVMPEDEKNIAIVFSNKASSLDTDRKHQASIEDEEGYGASPSVFVYTLPNICIGEISIKYKLYSENSFFIFDRFNAAHLHQYAESLLKTEKADEVLCGWVDVDGESYSAYIYLVSQKGEIQHKEEEIYRLYNN